MFQWIWSHKHTGTALQAEMCKLCELLLPSQGVFWIDPEIHSSALDSLSSRPNGSIPASLSSQPSSDKQTGRLVSSQPKARWLRDLGRESFVWRLPLLSFAHLQRSLINSRGQWWSFTSARRLICLCSPEREAEQLYSDSGFVTKYAPVLYILVITNSANTSLDC